MSSEFIGIILDFVVLIFLGATIYYVARLTKNLNAFKAHRSEFDGVIADLLSSIDQAERSVNTLKQVSAQEGIELDGLINQAKSMSDELKIINQAGESIAIRLEKLAEQNGKLAKRSKSRSSLSKNNITSHISDNNNDYRSTLKKVDKDNTNYPSFMIQDKEVDFDDGVEIDEPQSHAERELLSALRVNKNNISE